MSANQYRSSNTFQLRHKLISSYFNTSKYQVVTLTLRNLLNLTFPGSYRSSEIKGRMALVSQKVYGKENTDAHKRSPGSCSSWTSPISPFSRSDKKSGLGVFSSWSRNPSQQPDVMWGWAEQEHAFKYNDTDTGSSGRPACFREPKTTAHWEGLSCRPRSIFALAQMFLKRT